MATTTYDAQGAYNAIKQLESQNTILFPQTTQTVHIGSFDASTGKFTYAVQTGYQRYGVRTGGGGPTGPAGPGGGGQPLKPLVAVADPVSPFKRVELGYVIAYAMDLKLSFSVVNAGASTFTVTANGVTQTITTQPVTVTPGPILPTPIPTPEPVPTPTPTPVPPPLPPAPVPRPTPAPPPPTPHPVNPIHFHPNEVAEMAVIGGGPFDGNVLTIDLGPFATVPVPEWIIPGTEVTLKSGSKTASIRLMILRPPVGTAGVFTMPALPTALVYAPPLGPQKKNFASYSSSTVITSKISTTVTSSNSTKTATAYSKQDFFDKLVGFGASIAGFATTIASLGAAPSGGTGVVGGLLSFLTGSSSKSSSGGSALNDVKAITSGMQLVQNIIDGFAPTSTTSDVEFTSGSQENDMQTTDTTTLTFATPATFGPGQGDVFGMLLNVLVAWAITDNELAFTVLSYEGIRQYAAETLLLDLQTLNSGGTLSQTITKLDAATIENLLSLDPLVKNPSTPPLDSKRFVLNSPATIGDSGTAAMGSPYTVTHTVTSTESTTQNQTKTTITDYKPGWLGALFGTSPNTATESQMSMSYTNGNQQSQTYTVTSTVTLFADVSDANMLEVYFDTLFNTFLYLPYPPAGQST